MKKAYAFARGLIWLPVKLLYPTKVLCRENLPADTRLITVTNHYSWKDVPILAVSLKGYRRFIAKQEIGKNKLVHKVAESIGVIFIHRGSADLHAMRESIRTLQAGDSIAIFPEGTRNRTDSDALQDIKGGVTLLALKGNAPIVPVMLHARERLFRRNYLYVGKPFDLSAFHGKKLDADAIAKASDLVAAHMEQTREEMDVFIREKGWKNQRRERKARKRLQRKQNAEAKRAYARYRRSLRTRSV